ncbi:peptide/nickel transport system substrate-binding protein [Virgibacillus subterraneus]|uniref:Peptide/nickel transport system substrate-binding protein n=1 Tax=Virgibacillus subterraneus TaxID=621109 RepID=A0A1H9G5I7_9BACI|nr:ABC transporter substrate-binding protein [Virgibacillus subterraneus]SEQ45425.1 peptide/nickel transport system substrate-binding protein [Virgibacillus subterraneus]
MKKVLIVFMMLLFSAILMSACSNDEKVTNETDSLDNESSNDNSNDAKTEASNEALLVGDGNGEVFGETFRTFWVDNPNGIEYWINRGLLKRDADMKNVHEDLAAKYEVSDDELTYTFTLKDVVKWHDGEEFTAEDVKWSIETAIKFPTAVDTWYAFDAIKGYEAYKEGEVDNLEGVKIKGNTVSIELRYPYGMFLQKISNFDILPKHLLGDADIVKLQQDPYWKKPIGTGPYKITEVKFGEYAVLEAFEDYDGPEPNVKKVLYQRIPEGKVLPKIQAKELDYIGALRNVDLVDQISKVPGYKVHKVPQIYNRYFMVNMKGSQKLEDIKVRQAILHAIDRKTIVEETFKGQAEVADGHVPPSFADEHNKNIEKYEYDPDKAVELLEEAGFDFSQPLKIAYYYDNQETVDLMNIVAFYLEEIGVKTEISLLKGDLLELIYHQADYDIIYAALSQPDPASAIQSYSEGSLMFQTVWDGYQYDQVFSLQEELAQTSDLEDRARLIKEIDKIQAESLYILPFYHMNVYAAVNESRLKTAGEYGNEWVDYKRHLENWQLKN